jgi:hypothetical protein
LTGEAVGVGGVGRGWAIRLAGLLLLQQTLPGHSLSSCSSCITTNRLHRCPGPAAHLQAARR